MMLDWTEIRFLTIHAIIPIMIRYPRFLDNNTLSALLLSCLTITQVWGIRALQAQQLLYRNSTGR